MESLWIPLDNVQDMKPDILVELNPIILGRDVERIGHYLEKPRR